MMQSYGNGFLIRSKVFARTLHKHNCKSTDHGAAGCSGAVEEILLRIPPEEPATLIRASLACKPWCRLLSGDAFRSRYRTLHRTAPILGFLQSWEEREKRFIPTTNFGPHNPKRQDSAVLDCRHGRILLRCEGEEDDEEDLVEEDDDMEEDEEDEEEEDDREKEDNLEMVVWDPVSGGRSTRLRYPINSRSYSATVLYAVDGCNHVACYIGPFFVAFIGLENDEDEDYDDDRPLWASLYSSETQKWTSPSPASVDIGGIGKSGAYISFSPSVLLGGALHVLLLRDRGGNCILKYRSLMRQRSFDAPEVWFSESNAQLVSTDASGLGLVHLEYYDQLCILWSMEVSVDGVASWIRFREIELKKLVSILNPMDLYSLSLVGCVEGTDIIIAVTDLDAFTMRIDVKSLRLRKLPSKPYVFTRPQYFRQRLFLYTSFNNPPVGVVAVAETDISK